jgi:hypothetical protein
MGIQSEVREDNITWEIQKGNENATENGWTGKQSAGALHVDYLLLWIFAGLLQPHVQLSTQDGVPTRSHVALPEHWKQRKPVKVAIYLFI